MIVHLTNSPSRPANLGEKTHHVTVCVPMHGMHGRVWNSRVCTHTSRQTKTIEWRSGVLQRCVGFININDMYNNDVGKGGVYAYEAYEVK